MNNSANVQEDQIHSRAVVWVDHLRAKIFSMGLTGISSIMVHAHLSSPHLHHKANSIGAGRVEDDPILEQIAKAVASCVEVLILGQGTEKTALLQYLERAFPQMVLRPEACDHPTDPEIIALDRKHFRIT